MRVEGLVLLVLTVFCAIVAFIFWAFGLHDIYRQITGGGTIMLVAVALLGLLPGGYYLWWSRRMTPRAEDDPLADPSSSAGVVGAFPSSSVWPFVLGMAALLVALALVFGFWSAVFGITLALSAVVGIIMESRRGGLV